MDNKYGLCGLDYGMVVSARWASFTNLVNCYIRGEWPDWSEEGYGTSNNHPLKS